MSQDNSLIDYMLNLNIPALIKRYANEVSNNLNFKRNSSYTDLRFAKCKPGFFTSIVRCESFDVMQNFMKTPIIKHEEVAYYYVTKKNIIYLFRRYTKDYDVLEDILEKNESDLIARQNMSNQEEAIRRSRDLSDFQDNENEFINLKSQKV